MNRAVRKSVSDKMNLIIEKNPPVLQDWRRRGICVSVIVPNGGGSELLVGGMYATPTGQRGGAVIPANSIPGVRNGQARSLRQARQ